MAKIECTIKREGGTRVEVEGKEYHFAPQPNGAHVAEVADSKHASILLKIAEAYVHYKVGGPSAVVADVVQTVADVVTAHESQEAQTSAAPVAPVATAVLTPAQKAAATKAAKAAAAKAAAGKAN